MSQFKLSRLLPKFFRGDKDKNIVACEKAIQSLGEKSKDFICKILFLDDTELTLAVKPNAKAQVLLDYVFEHLNLLEREYFGLRYVDQNNQTHWLDAFKTVSSQLKGVTPLILYFVVKFYAADPCKLREEITRYFFFLQIKRDIFDGRLPVLFDEAVELAAYSLQSELGDYNSRKHTAGYVSEFRFIFHQTPGHEESIAALHRKLAGKVPAMVEYWFLEKAKWLEMYGVDLHPVLGDGNSEYLLGITPAGIVLYKSKNKVGNYFWPRITKVRFRDKIFTIKVKDRNNDEHWHVFELATKAACKHLWKCCVEQHAFFRLNQIGDPCNAMGRIFSMGSKQRYSGRTERMLKENRYNRHQPEVNRISSRRHQRRVSSDPKISSQYLGDKSSSTQGPTTMVITPEPVRIPRLRSLPELQGKYASKDTQSYVWEYNAGGLYTSGKDSPLSTKSEKLKFQVCRRRISGSDSENGYKRRYSPNKRGSDNESDVSLSRRRREDESCSGSETSRRKHTDHQSRGPGSGEDSKADGWRTGVLTPLHNAPGAEGLQKRRRRRRSKSPSKCPPEELRRHFAYDLVDTSGMSQDQLQEIPYIKVETKAEPYRIKHSPKSKHHSNKVSRNRGCRDSSDPGGKPQSTPEDDPPPPYTPTMGSKYFDITSNMCLTDYRFDESEVVKRAGSVYHQEPDTAPPANRTKPDPSVISPTSPVVSHFQHHSQPQTHSQLNKNMADMYHIREDSGLGNDNDFYVNSHQSSRRSTPSGHSGSPRAFISNRNRNEIMPGKDPVHRMVPQQNQTIINNPDYLQRGHLESSESQQPRHGCTAVTNNHYQVVFLEGQTNEVATEL